MGTPLRHDGIVADVVTRTANGDGLPEEGFAIAGLAYHGKVPFNGREADAFATTARGTRNGLPGQIPVLLVCASAQVAGEMTAQILKCMIDARQAGRPSYEGYPLPLNKQGGHVTVLVTRTQHPVARDLRSERARP